MSTYLTAIIPAFNEEGIIEANVLQVLEHLERVLPSGRAFEILVINDGSADATPGIIDALAAREPRVRTAHHPRNMGRGRALRTGFEHARGDYIVTLDADLSYEPYHIERLLEPLLQGQADIVLASAYHPGGTVRNVPFTRAFISRLGNMFLARSVPGGLHTVTCVVRGYRREIVDTLELTSDGKDLHLEILQKSLLFGFRIVEVPADLCWRTTKRTAQKKGLSLKKFATMAGSHLFFNFLFRPGLLFYGPLLLTLLIMAAILVSIGGAYIDLFSAQPVAQPFLERLQDALRQVILQAKISFFLLGFCVLFLFQFGSITFLAKQIKHTSDDHYVVMCRINTRLKEFLNARKER